jgi:hypothetical protein
MVDESGEKQIGKPGKTIAPLESQIGTTADNNVVTNSEKQKQESFDSTTMTAVSANADNSLQIVSGDDVLVDSHANKKKNASFGGNPSGEEFLDKSSNKVFIPGAGEVELNAEAMLQTKADPLRKADGSFRDNLIAQTDFSKPIEVGIDENVKLFQDYVDSNNVVPFGGKIDCGVSGFGTSEYATFTLGLDGQINGKNHDRQVINVNISDQLKVNGLNVFDGKPHRATFPIAPPHDAPDNRHWKWIDATIQKVGNTHELVIYGLSPSPDKPTKDSQFDHLNNTGVIYKMKMSPEPHHANADNFWQTMDGNASPQGGWEKSFSWLKFPEQIK